MVKGKGQSERTQFRLEQYYICRDEIREYFKVIDSVQEENQEKKCFKEIDIYLVVMGLQSLSVYWSYKEGFSDFVQKFWWMLEIEWSGFLK